MTQKSTEQSLLFERGQSGIDRRRSLQIGDLHNAVFVGEETAGKPNHFGEVRSFQLPSSKVLVNYSTKYFKRSEKEIETIEPDMSIEMSFADFKKGVDPVFEWIKAQ